MSAKRNHAKTYRFLWNTIGPVIRFIFRFKSSMVQVPSEPYLVLVNHNTDLDAALVALSFREHMYFVVSEHALRKGFSSWLLRSFFAPIPRVKGTADAQAALDIIRALRHGNNVCLFAEGNRSFTGVTGAIFPATGKLAKAAGVTLVTYRIEGGYLTAPRWGRTQRRGKMTGTCVNIYSPDQLRSMTADEVNKHIAEDLFEDAFLRQKKEKIRFRGKRLAEGLENALFLCPSCGGIGTLKGKGDLFSCTCGLMMRYTEYGFFEGENAPFSCVRDWDVWQNGRLEELAATKGLVFSDQDTQLFVVDRHHRMSLIDKGVLSMDAETLKLGETWFLLTDISDIAMVGASKLLLNAQGRHYEIRAPRKYYCGRKYFLLYRLYISIKEKERIEELSASS